MTIPRYSTARAFKDALEHRLKAMSASGTDFARRRQLLVFDRFLARVAQVAGDSFILKGGLVLELRLTRARTTKDVDLRMLGSPSAAEVRLQQAGRLDLGDHMRFEVRSDDGHPEILNEALHYEGRRFRAECRLAGKLYGSPFGVDVAFGDPVVGEPDLVVAENTLGFAGISPPTLRLYPVVSHLAEKLHALTMPRSRPNSRVRDLPDIALLATTGPLEARLLRHAIDCTFEFRNTHPVPLELPSPPEFWGAPYAAIAAANVLPWSTLREAIEAAEAFLNPVLMESSVLSFWEPERWLWREE